ncbi:alpha/beta fold hydrolase [Streptomyces paromomycinus]|uniref:Hydrolase n=1 Tax=Streptomyces paromomycinus TaxID=92743 RepID=A0A401WFQ1_STREY|nr:alpha/beta hydrolase [Streptomyces paromomycinus]GCD48110.1 hydrolase [Streptomyces paromomycinus]
MRNSAAFRRFVDNREFLPQDGLPQPTLFSAGEHDTLTPLEALRSLAERCADARLFSIDDCDHLMALERTDEVADLISRFFGGQSPENLPYGHQLFAPPA